MHALVLTLACWHGATPGAIAGAGPGHSLVLSDHHVARLAQERHVLAHRGFVSNPQTIGWDAGVTTGNHCQTTTSLNHRIVSAALRNNCIGQGRAKLGILRGKIE